MDHSTTQSNFLRLIAWASLLLAAIPLTDSAEALSISQRVIHTFSWGDRTYTCLNIEGGQVPLPIPPLGGPKVTVGSGVAITWPADGATAIIRNASKPEAALIDLMDKPEGADAWKKYIVSRLHGEGYTATVGSLQPDCLDVNHWRMGAITMDYALGGRKSSALLLLWRCKDGSTLAVTMDTDPAALKTHVADLFTLLGGALVIPPGR